MTTTEDLPGTELEVRPDAEVSPVVDAELVPLEKPEPPERPTLIGQVIEHPVQSAIRGVIVIRESPKARKAVTPVRVTMRAGYTTGQGFKSWAARGWDGWRFGRLKRACQAAEAENDREGLLKAEESLRKAKAARKDGFLKAPLVFGACVAVTLGALVAVWVLMAIGGVLVFMFPGGSTWTSWWDGCATFWDGVGTWGRRAVWAVLWALGPIIVWAAWWEGKHRARQPRWLVTDREQAEMDSVIDERMVSLALANLGIAPLTKFFADGGQLTYLAIPRKDGDGTFTRVRLCLGVTVEMVNRYRPKLAGNLNRAPLEVWPTEHDEASIMDLWIADKGKLNAGAGPWPLLDDGTVDVFEGVPIGRSQRGEVILAPLFETNWIIGGRPGQGKTASIRSLLMGAGLDPTVEEWVFVFGESPDFDPLRPRLARYEMGLDDEVFGRAIQALRDLMAEMERRGKLLGQQPGTPPRTNRKLADKPALGLHILVAAFDEVHELFMHPEYGKEAADLVIRLGRRTRKYGIVLLFGTQAPTAESIPRDVTRQMSCGVAFSVQDHVANDGLLGTGKYKMGIRATELRMNVDRGTAVTVGITQNDFELIRWFYIPFSEGVDAVTPVVNRMMANIKELRRTAEPKVIEQAPPPDHLADIHDALRGEARVRTAVVLGRLIEANAGLYEPWGFQDLSAVLDDAGVPVGKSNGQRVIRAEDVEEALRLREEEDE